MKAKDKKKKKTLQTSVNIFISYHFWLVIHAVLKYRWYIILHLFFCLLLLVQRTCIDKPLVKQFHVLFLSLSSSSSSSPSSSKIRWLNLINTIFLRIRYLIRFLFSISRRSKTYYLVLFVWPVSTFSLFISVGDLYIQTSIYIMIDFKRSECNKNVWSIE